MVGIKKMKGLKNQIMKKTSLFICTLLFISSIVFYPKISFAYPFWAQQNYESPREATGKIVCANCHLAQMPTIAEVPQSVGADSVFKAVVKIPYKKDLKEIGSKLAMHVAAQAPIAIDENGIKKEVLDKELEIIKEELKNSGKKTDMIEKIANGKIKKFISDNTLLNQLWIMDTKMKVSQIIKKYSEGEDIKVIDFIRFKVGEGID